MNPSTQIEQTNYIIRNPIIKKLLSNFIEKIAQMLVAIGAPDKQGIDAGCGEAHMLARLHQKGAVGNLIAVDVNQTYLNLATRNNPCHEFISADLVHLPFPDYTFDYVISTEVLEHLENPEHAIVELRRVGKKGAYLIVSVPFEPFFHWGNLARGKYWNRGGYTPDHRNLWRRRNFRKFLAPFVHIEKEYGFNTFPWLLYSGRFRE